MSKGSTQTRLNNILAENAGSPIEVNRFKVCVRKWQTTWREDERTALWFRYRLGGLQEIPGMDHAGIRNDNMRWSNERPSRVRMRQTDPCLYRAGVGSLAGAVQDSSKPLSGQSTESDRCRAEAAACLYKGAGSETAASDRRRRYGHDHNGSCMREPNTISWDILKNHVDTFVAAPDW